ncbi:MAG: ATP-binding cassette domain-containing protein [Prevotellaceae bacterium]|jgi:ABC-2 type transport system ATP-binding protein|nr:ATP-binding cassette domain-containing protein [Prevotellaceae bacterium]
MNTILEIDKLSKHFGSLVAVDDISFSVEKGNVYGLLGPNGSGKTTTLGMILNVVNPTKGTWRWFGKTHSSNSLKKIGAIIERPNFYPYLSAAKNLEIVATIKQSPFSRIDEKLELVDLLHRKNDRFAAFSLGMKQRLAIAAALLNNPEVLILDEPTNGLDPQGIIKIREIIMQIANMGTTIILASHLLDEVEKVCSHVVVLNKGKSIYCGAVENMSNELGYFELGTANIDELVKILAAMPYFDKITRNQNFVSATLKTDLNAEELNKMLVNQGIFLNHLVKRRDNLEQQFLNLIKNETDITVTKNRMA